MEALKLKTGFDLEEKVDDLDPEVVETTAGLMKIFTEAALETAAQYAIGDSRNVVTKDDIIKSLKYQARLFFQENSDNNIEERIREAIEEMDESSYEESSDEDSYEDDTGGEEEDTDDTDDTDDMEVEIDALPEEEIKKCRHMKFKIDEIVRTWDKFSPTDKLILNIKNAIEKTEQHFSDSSHMSE